MINTPTVLYVVMFSDQRIKIGISGDVSKRMTYYTQEAQRNRVSYLTWWACKPFARRSDALEAERVLCHSLAAAAMPRHREWFDALSSDFPFVIKLADELRLSLGDEVGNDRLDVPFLGSHGSWERGAAA